MTVQVLRKLFPIKNNSPVAWDEVFNAYSEFEHLLGSESLDAIALRGGFTPDEWDALKSRDELLVKSAFNWYAKTLIRN